MTNERQTLAKIYEVAQLFDKAIITIITVEVLTKAMEIKTSICSGIN